MPTEQDPQHVDPAEAFFRACAAAGLTPIQFKSSRTLDRAFAAMEDFDLLVSPEQFDDVLRTAEFLGFRMRTTTDPFHPGPIVDLLGWDPTLGRLHHLSLHRQLVLGERPVKRHVIPWEAVSSVATIEHRPGLHVLPPAAELALLLTRIVLRSSLPGRLRSPWRRIPAPLDPRMRDEARALDPGVSEVALRHAVTVLVPGAEDLLTSVRRRIVTDAAVTHARQPVVTEVERRDLVRTMRPLAIRSPAEVLALRLRHARSRTVRRLTHGAVIAVVGADGAGKSTVTSRVAEVLGAKLTVRTVYLGLPKDATAIAALSILSAAARRLRLAGMSRWMASARPVLTARIRRRAIDRAHRDARSGAICVSDRFPLAEFRTIDPPMDGPRLSGRGLLARVERNVYDAVTPPDLVVALVAEPDLLIARKPGDEEPRIVRAKAEAVRGLAAAREDVVTVDAALPLEQVVSAVVTAIWDLLGRQSEGRVRSSSSDAS